ncbi:MAG TPA: HDOD domain-containing protein [Gemmataceae bacterium]|nr:HDOD domain-containing protein [Gemmataceae bacterium]
MHVLDLLRRKNGPADADPRSPADILKGTVGSLNKLPMMPESATRAMAVANDVNSSLRDFAAVIERDPALAAGILKLANSPLYRVGRTIESLDQAVLRLGLRECKNLIVAVGMRTLLRGCTPAKKAQCDLLWRHSFVTACLCRRLSRSLELGYRGEEFSCGLAHDLGRILIAIGVPSHFDVADPMTFREGPELLAHEQEVLGTDHCYFGAWFANLNQLPASLVTAIQFHHVPHEAVNHRALVGVVATADHMANHLQREKGAAGYDLAANPGWRFLAQSCDGGMKAKLEALAVSIMEEAADEAREVVTAGG